MPGFSFLQTEPIQGQNSGSFRNNETGESQQYHHDPIHAQNGFDTISSFQINQDGQAGTQVIIPDNRSQWNTSPTHHESVQMSRLQSQESTGAHSQRATHADQSRSRLYSVASQTPYMSSANSDITGRSSPVDSGLYGSQPLEPQGFDGFSFPGSEDVSGGQSNFHRDSVVLFPQPGNPLDASFNMFAATSDDTFQSSNGSNNVGSHGLHPVSQESVIFNPNATIASHSPTLWEDNFVLESHPSSPILEGWVLPPPQMVTTATNSPLDYSPSLDGVSPRYVVDSPVLVDVPPYTTGGRVTRKPVGPRQSKVQSDLASRQQLHGTSETSDESFRLIGRSSLEIDNTARDHPLYQNVTPQADGLYHCHWEGKEGCLHKPDKLKCNYDKFVDSHLKPYRCKVVACEDSRFSSTACLLRHEREAHAMHGHGDKPYLCTYEGCERGATGNGFPRHWNLRDHMKRVHNDPGTSTKSNASGSPPPSNATTKGRKRKVEASEGPFAEKALKRVATPPVVAPEQHEPSLVDRYLQSQQKALEIVKQLNDPSNASNMTLLRSVNDCIKVMAQTTQRIHAAPAINYSQQQR